MELGAAEIGGSASFDSSSLEEAVNLNCAKVAGSALLREGATFKGDIDLIDATIGSNLGMDGLTFEGTVNLNGAKVAGGAFLRGGATFKSDVDLVTASLNALEMTGSTFEGRVIAGMQRSPAWHSWVARPSRSISTSSALRSAPTWRWGGRPSRAR